MKAFLDENFLLNTSTAQQLYHEHAAQQPIIDYHCHLSPQDVAEDRRFGDLFEAWLEGDHYKWRAMRTNGVDERYCTGKATPEEKFIKWAETVPSTLRNPLYHWTHLELQRHFGIATVLSPNTARTIWAEANEKLKDPALSARGILRRMKVEVVCTTDDPADSLEHHQKIKADGFEVKILPTFRADKAMAVEQAAAYNTYLDRLGAAAQTDINSYTALMNSLQKRHDFFHAQGCRLSDHGIEVFYAEDYSSSEVETAFAQIRKGKELSPGQILQFKSAVLHDLALMDHAKGWVQQFHFGALRNNNARLVRSLGPDTGFDSIGDWPQGAAMAKFLSRLDSDNQLAKTILYNLNPADNYLVGTMIGNFQDGTVPGKLQFGSGWWFNDQKEGMQAQLNALSNLGLLPRFVGMLTDSRSFLSYPRHEYFRRILCQLLGQDVENGELPLDTVLLGKTVENICYGNAREYFGFDRV